MEVEELGLKGVKLLTPKYFEDFRGYYCETYSARTMKELGCECVFVQDNHILSLKRGTIRGIHFQNAPGAQAKLLRCTKGSIMDYAVDLMSDSPTYKKWACAELSADNRKQIFIPRGYAHALITLCDDCEVQYKVDNLYEPALDRAITWDDPDIAIDWGTDKPILSQKDLAAPTLRDSDINFTLEVMR